MERLHKKKGPITKEQAIKNKQHWCENCQGDITVQCANKQIKAKRSKFRELSLAFRK